LLKDKIPLTSIDEVRKSVPIYAVVFVQLNKCCLNSFE
jgi:hypothetical protein